MVAREAVAMAKRRQPSVSACKLFSRDSCVSERLHFPSNRQIHTYKEKGLMKVLLEVLLRRCRTSLPNTTMCTLRPSLIFFSAFLLSNQFRHAFICATSS